MIGLDTNVVIRYLTRDVNKWLNTIAKIGSDFPISTAVEELKKHDFYSDWQKELQYFFLQV